MSYQWHHNSLIFHLLLVGFTDDFLSSLSSWLSPLNVQELLVWLICHHPPHDELARFVLLVDLDLIFLVAMQNGAQAIISPATLTALAECYGGWYFYFSSSGLVMMPHCPCQSPHSWQLAIMYILAGTPLPSLLQWLGSD